MEIKTLSRLAGFQADKMKKVSLFATERVMTDLYCMEPGQAQKVHAHDGEDKVYCVLSGQGTVTVGAESAPIAAGQVVIAPAGKPHGLTNGPAGRMEVLVFMAPNSHFEGGHGHEHGHGHGHGHSHGPGHGHSH